MKLILCAMALTFAVPAAAQTAPAMDHSQHSPAQHAQHGAGHDQHKGGHDGHGKDAKHECPMKADGKKMACCDHAKGECTMAKDGKAMECCKHDDHKAGGKAHADHGGH
jgi:hypothetical protein